MHARLKEAIEKFFSKIEAEEKKYRARMEELEVNSLQKIIHLTHPGVHLGWRKHSVFPTLD